MEPERGAHDQAHAAVDPAIVERWRNATPAEHGRTLWGLLEFADLVHAGRGTRLEREPLRRLPKLRAGEHQT